MSNKIAVDIPKILESIVTRIAANDVHVWQASLNQPTSCIKELAEILSGDERARAERFYFERARRRFITGRGLLRRLLGCYLDLAPTRLQFRYGSRGKPSVAEPANRGLCFNVTHSGDTALFIFACHREVGIDIECVRPIANLDDLVAHTFSAHEKAVLHALPSDQKLKAFYRGWTRKEAYIKATGDGLVMPLDQVDVSLVPGKPAQLRRVEGDTLKAARWALQDVTLTPEYVAAICVEGHGWNQIYREVEV